MGANLSKVGATNPIECFSDLPDSIIAEIISALPTKSILRCRCVCKTWLLLISSTYFNKVVLKKRSCLTFVLEGLYGGYFLFEFLNRTSLTKARFPVKPLKLNSKFDKLPVSSTPLVIGVCNGLFCVVDSLPCIELVYIWNPVLGQYVMFPAGEEIKYTPVGYGFGYSHITDQYKVIIILKKGTFFVIEILTLGLNTWRTVGNTRCRPKHKLGLCHFTGIVHWICGDDSHVEWICSFNISTEQQGFVSPPPDCISERPGRTNLVLKVVRDCLCVIKNTYRGYILWSMKDYGVAESWSKHVFIDIRDSFKLSNPEFVTTMWEDEDLLFFQFYGNLGYFDSKKMQYVVLKTTIDDIHHLVKSAAYPFIPSFVPLLEVLKEEPSKMLIPQKGCYRLLLSILRSYIYKCVLV